MVQGLGFRIQGLGFRIQCLKFSVYGSGVSISAFWLWVQG